MPSISLSRHAPGHLILTVDQQRHALRFPATGNLEQIGTAILSGAEYPALQLPGWSPRTVIDIGANVGFTAIYFALAYPRATIRAFEPSPSTAAWLEHNTAWLPHVETHHIGLFDRTVETELYQGTEQCAQASVGRSSETQPDNIERIRLEPAAAHISSVAQPAILKLDTEGCEVPILTQLAPILDNFDVIYVEWHSERDRRQIERLLGERFSLWKARAHAVHRGTAAWIHARVLTAHPLLGSLEIPRPLEQTSHLVSGGCVEGGVQ